jgi:hypothetical protein
VDAAIWIGLGALALFGLWSHARARAWRRHVRETWREALRHSTGPDVVL